MNTIEEVHCRASVHSVLKANQQLMFSTLEDALAPIKYGKSDTLGLDGIPEGVISDSLSHFDPDAILITEEIGTSEPEPGTRRRQRPSFYLSDPTDRSSQFKQFLLQEQEGLSRNVQVGEVVSGEGVCEKWESHFGGPASISGATSAITCIRYGVPIASAIVNLITQELFVAYRDGVFQMKIPDYKSYDPSQFKLEDLKKEEGQEVSFRKFGESGTSFEDMKKFITFLGKDGYNENFDDSNLLRIEEKDKYLKYALPGGPSRPFYLSSVQPQTEPIGFILANGEKIGEWIHWIPIIRFGTSGHASNRQELSFFEIAQERPWTKDGILMSTLPPYSVFQKDPVDDRFLSIDFRKLQSFSNPSQIRSTVLVASKSNSWVRTVMKRNVFREINFAPPPAY